MFASKWSLVTGFVFRVWGSGFGFRRCRVCGAGLSVEFGKEFRDSCVRSRIQVEV